MTNDSPKQLELKATMEIDVVADGLDGKAPLPRFSMVAYTGGPMRIGGWRFPVIVDLAGLAIPSQNRPIRFGHDANSGVGHTDSIAITDGRLVAAGVVSRDTAAAREVVASARNGFPWQASIGTSVEQFEFVKESQMVLVNGREFAGPVNVVRRSALGEISFVDLGADSNTSASVAASATQEKNMEGTEIKEDVKVEGSEGKDAAGKVQAQAPAGTEAGGAPTPPPVVAAADPIAELRDKMAAEQARIAAVRAVCGDDHADLCAKAIKEGWDANRTELQVLRDNRPKAPSVHAPDNIVNGSVLEAACMLTAKLPDLDKRYDERTLDQADKRFGSGIHLQELLLEKHRVKPR